MKKLMSSCDKTFSVYISFVSSFVPEFSMKEAVHSPHYSLPESNADSHLLGLVTGRRGGRGRRDNTGRCRGRWSSAEAPTHTVIQNTRLVTYYMPEK